MQYNAWKVAFAGLWLKMWTTGVFKSVGTLYVPFMDEFKCTYEEAAWPGSLSITIQCITGPLAGILVCYIKPRPLLIGATLLASFSVALCYFATSIFQVTLIYGLGLGVGIGIVECLCPVIVAQNFYKQRRAVGVGITMVGSSLGSFCFPLVTQFLMKRYDLLGTLMILGGLMLHGLLGALVLTSNLNTSEPIANIERPNYGTISEKVAKKRKSSYWDSGEFNHIEISFDDESTSQTKVIPNPQKPVYTDKPEMTSYDQFPKKKGCWWQVSFITNLFYLSSIIIYTTAHFGIFSFVTILPDYGSQKGLEEKWANLLMSVVAISELLGKFLTGWLSFCRILTNTEVFMLSAVLLGVCYILLFFLQEIGSFLIVVIAEGYFGGAILILMPVLATEFVGNERAALGFGIATFAAGMLSFSRPYVIGYVQLQTGSYDEMFFLNGIAVLASVVILSLAYIVARCNGKRH